MEIIFLGRGGQGAFTSSRLLGIVASLYEEKHALAFPSFGPERRGAPVFAYTKISDTPIRDRSQTKKADYMILLDETLYEEALLERVKEKILINTATKGKYPEDKCVSFNALELAEKYLGKPITNTAMLAFFIKYTGAFKLESLKEALWVDLAPKLAEKNSALVEAIWKMELAGKVEEK